MLAARPILCMVTSGRLSPHDSRDAVDAWLARMAAAARAGVTLIQIREPNLDGRALAAVAGSAVGAVSSTDARIIVNDRFDVAVAAGAHGVHLKERSMRPDRVRAAVGASFIIGRSIHAARDARIREVDYLIFGPVFETSSKPEVQPQGLAALQDVIASAEVPVLAIGGVSESTLPAVVASGAAGVAAIGYFDVPPALCAERCARVRRAFDTS
jgi:thiamine-phosphate diphosphorylase